MNEPVINPQEEKIDLLLKEFDYHREAIKKMIAELEKIRTKIDKVIPETLDMRYIRYFEEKVKSVTNLFNSLLEMRKEIAKSVKDEIEIRRKMVTAQEEFDPDELLDVRKMVEKFEQFQDETKKMKQKFSGKKSIQEQIKEQGIDVPGLTYNLEGNENDGK